MNERNAWRLRVGVGGGKQEVGGMLGNYDTSE